jgi:putative transposase
MSRRGNGCDNAMMESFKKGPLESRKCFARERAPTRQAARLMLFDCIEGFYNRSRLHGGIGCKSPLAFEETIGCTLN